MNILTDNFYNGLMIGVIVGMTLNTIKNYIFKNKLTAKEYNSSAKLKGEFKMALLVRHDLKMGKGKVAAQCSHAIVHSYEEGLKSKPTEIINWESNNKPIGIFKVADEETMLKYQQMALQEGFNTYIVIDAGRTQVAPRSKTVMAIGPAKCEQINLFTQDLQMYT